MSRRQPPPDPRQRLGRLGEDAAADALVLAGYRILERSYRCRMGEIDLIVDRGELLIFVEVKTRRDASHGEPAEAVTPAKQRRIGRVAAHYLQRRRQEHRPCRFDVVEVFPDPSVPGEGGPAIREVRHIEDAFLVDA